MEKKEEKVREMNDLLKTDIEPQMEKLRKVLFYLKYLKIIFPKGKRSVFTMEIRSN